LGSPPRLKFCLFASLFSPSCRCSFAFISASSAPGLCRCPREGLGWKASARSDCVIATQLPPNAVVERSTTGEKQAFGGWKMYGKADNSARHATRQYGRTRFWRPVLKERMAWCGVSGDAFRPIQDRSCRWRLRRRRLLVQPPRVATLFKLRDSVVRDGVTLVLGQSFFQTAHDLSGASKREATSVKA
jgi:hypothetical protein